MAASSPDDLFDDGFFSHPRRKAQPAPPAGYPVAAGMRKYVVTSLNWGVGEAEGAGYSDYALKKPPFPGHGRGGLPSAWAVGSWGR
jgi:hypothetical protein